MVRISIYRFQGDTDEPLTVMLKVNTAFNVLIKAKGKNGRVEHEIYKDKIPTVLFLVPSFTIIENS